MFSGQVICGSSHGDCQPSRQATREGAIAAVTVLFVGIFGWPILPVMLGMAPISIGIAYKQARP